jgi:Cu(I)/Ag(I) efflux system membrane fusion protein
MTASPVHNLRAPAAAALGTALLFTGALWAQHARGAWPFVPVVVDHGATPIPAASASGGAGDDRVPVEVNAAMVRTLGIHVVDVRREALMQELRAVATVSPDESRISHVHTRVAGWLERLDVDTTGEVVRAGQPLARIFSQELLSSQVEYLSARKTTAASGITSAVVASGRPRLGVLGMSPAEIDEIDRTGEPMRLVTVVAPRTGVVVNRGVSAGTAVDPSTTLLTIADLSRVWVIAEVSETDIPAIRLGGRAQLDFPGSGRAPFAARVEFLYPTLSERTRTLRVRFAVVNPGGTLRPGLYGAAVFEIAGAPVLTVPRDAIVDTGRQQHVFVSAGDRFEPRRVTLGVQLADRVEVRTGLIEGEQIAAAGVFLLDSESRLRATGGGGGHSHAPSPPRDPTKTPEKPPVDPHAGHGSVPPPAPADPHAGHRR